MQTSKLIKLASVRAGRKHMSLMEEVTVRQEFVGETTTEMEGWEETELVERFEF